MIELYRVVVVGEQEARVLLTSDEVGDWVERVLRLNRRARVQIDVVEMAAEDYAALPRHQEAAA